MAQCIVVIVWFGINLVCHDFGWDFDDCIQLVQTARHFVRLEHLQNRIFHTGAGWGRIRPHKSGSIRPKLVHNQVNNDLG